MYVKQLKEITDKVLWKKVETSKELFRLTRKYKLSEYMIEEIAEHIKNTKREEGYYNPQGTLDWWWRNVSWYQPMSDEFIETKIEENFMNWQGISCNSHLTEEFIDKHQNKLKWYYVCRFYPLSEQMIDKYSNKVFWKEIFQHQNLSEQFIIKNQEQISWNFLMKNKHLAKDFFERNKHLITVKIYAADFVKIIENQKLSEQTLGEIKKGKMAWGAISENGTLTRDFVLKHYDKINPRKVMRNYKVDMEVREEVEMIERMSGK